MKVRVVKPNNRKRAFEVRIGKRLYLLPYSQTESQPTTSDPVRRAFVDDEIGREGFTYVLAGAKAWLEHSVQLNLVPDKYPDGLPKT